MIALALVLLFLFDVAIFVWIKSLAKISHAPRSTLARDVAIENSLVDLDRRIDKLVGDDSPFAMKRRKNKAIRDRAQGTL